MFGDTLDELASLDATLEDAGDGSKAQGDARFNQLLAAAEGGDAEAQYELSVVYAAGRGDVPDGEREEQALLWLTRAANQGHPGAMAELGSLYMGTDDVMALRWLRPAAAQGHGGAQGNLGYMYEHGHGLPRDDAEAARLYRLAAEQGLAQAQHNLGVMYLHGQGVPKDTAEAARWFRLASDQGHPDAVAALGRTAPTHTLPSSPEPDEPKEMWRCFDETDFNHRNVLLTLTRLESNGEVSVAGTTHAAEFQVQGLNRRWDFGPDDDGTFDYMFLIEPGGTGLYYDFSRSTDGTARPSQRFRCEQSPTESAASAVGDDLGDVSGAAVAGRTGTDVRLPSVATTSVPPTCDVESRIDGEFEGWEGDTVVKLTNGQIWEQSEYHYEYSYSYMPRVTIFQLRGQCKMLVDGVDEPVGVSRLR